MRLVTRPAAGSSSFLRLSGLCLCCSRQHSTEQFITARPGPQSCREGWRKTGQVGHSATVPPSSYWSKLYPNSKAAVLPSTCFQAKLPTASNIVHKACPYSSKKQQSQVLRLCLLRRGFHDTFFPRISVLHKIQTSLRALRGRGGCCIAFLH